MRQVSCLLRHAVEMFPCRVLVQVDLALQQEPVDLVLIQDAQPSAMVGVQLDSHLVVLPSLWRTLVNGLSFIPHGG